MIEVKCQQCGEYIPADSKFCPNCGLALVPQGGQTRKATRIPCPDGTCTGSIGDDGKCSTCGLRQGEQPQKKCPYCAEIVNSAAVKCKHCGEILEKPSKHFSKPSKNKSRIILLLIVLWIAIVISSLMSPKSSQKHNIANNKQKTESNKFMAIVNAKVAVKNKIKDADSAKFRNIFYHKSAVCGEVNGKNSFNAYAGFTRFVSYGAPALTFFDDNTADFENFWGNACVK